MKVLIVIDSLCTWFTVFNYCTRYFLSALRGSHIFRFGGEMPSAGILHNKFIINNFQHVYTLSIPVFCHFMLKAFSLHPLIKNIMCIRSYTCTYLLLLLSGLFLLPVHSKAQSLGTTPALLEPSGTQYFQNQYLANPAMAGVDTGLHINAAYRNQWSKIDGAPVTQFLTADYAMGKRVGVGLNIFNDKAGLLNRTRVALTYAYHLPLSEWGQQLSFGLSLAWNVERLSTKDVDGEVNDPSIGTFNRRDDYFEASYGMAYTDGHLNLQGSIPNLRGLFTGTDKGVDGGNVFFTAASYKFITESAISSIEPKLCYRGVKGYDNIVDIGVNVTCLDNLANVMAMYHTSKSVTAGIGVNVLRTVAIQALYNSQTGGIKTYVDGTYEIGATIHLFR